MEVAGFATFYWLKIKASPGQKGDYTRSWILGVIHWRIPNLSLPHSLRGFWLFSWMDGGAIHGNGSISTVLLPSPFLITVRRMITFQVSFPSVFIDPSSWIKSHCYRVLWSPLWHSSHWGALSNRPPCWMRAPGAVVPAFTVSWSPSQKLSPPGT